MYLRGWTVNYPGIPFILKVSVVSCYCFYIALLERRESSFYRTTVTSLPFAALPRRLCDFSIAIPSRCAVRCVLDTRGMRRRCHLLGGPLLRRWRKPWWRVFVLQTGTTWVRDVRDGERGFLPLPIFFKLRPTRVHELLRELGWCNRKTPELSTCH